MSQTKINAVKKDLKDLESYLALLIKEENSNNTKILIENYKAFNKICSIFEEDGNCLKMSKISEICKWLKIRVEKNNSEKEIFMDMEECELHQITSHGRVYNKKSKEFLKVRDEKKYNKLSVSLCINGKPTRRCVHMLVAKYFVNNKNNYRYVKHIDKNVKNNHSSNLKWYDLKNL